MHKKTIDDLELKNKKVLIRVDFNVPIKDGIVQSDKRIVAAIPTIEKVIKSGGKAILFSHLGRIKLEADKQKKSLEPVAKVLKTKLNKTVKFINETKGAILEKEINLLQEGEILMFQNTRYEDIHNNAESKNNKELGKYWASLGDVFINDAFGTAHRAHASNVGIASNIAESAIGYLVKKELEMLKKGLVNPKTPFIAIIGGAKISDKITVIDNLLQKANKILIGGGMAYTFLKAQGYEIGRSLFEKDYVELAKSLLNKANDKIILPVDHAFASRYADLPRQITSKLGIPAHAMGLDIGPKTIKLFKQNLKGVKTVVWNGPMGVAEFDNFKQGTEEIAKVVASQNGIFSIIGGGDSAAAAIKLGFENKFTHISTGGGASLQYMEGKPLPGIDVIADK